MKKTIYTEVQLRLNGFTLDQVFDSVFVVLWSFFFLLLNSLVTPSGITSVPVGMETPDMIELRKKRIEDSMDQGGETPALYQVIPEKRTNVGGAMMGSAHIYDVAGVSSFSSWYRLNTTKCFPSLFFLWNILQKQFYKPN